VSELRQSIKKLQMELEAVKKRQNGMQTAIEQKSDLKDVKRVEEGLW